jgi:hypothetical protein
MATFTPEEEERFRQLARDRLMRQMEQQNVSMMTHTARPEAKKPTGPQALYMSNGELRQMPPLLGGAMAMGAGIEDVITNIGEMAGITTPEQARRRREKNELIRRYSPTGTFAGETLAASAPAFAIGGPVAATGRFLGMNPALTRAVTEGIVSAGVTSKPEERKESAFYGGVTSAAFPLLGGALRRLGRGIDMTESARLLTDKGATLTPGQLNPESNWAMLEESMARLPLLGPKVSKARQKGLRDAQTVVAQEAAPPGYNIKPEDDVNKLADQIVGAYNDAYQVGKGFPMMPVIMQAGRNTPLSNVLRVPSNAVADDASIKYADRFLKNEMSFIKSKGNALTSDDLFKVRSNIRREIRSINSRPNAPFKAADLLGKAEDEIERAIQSQLSGDVLSQVSEIDRQYRKYKTLERAINKAADRPEGFTPSEFARSVRETTRSDMDYATGGGPMRDLSQAFSETFPGRQPQTGASLPSAIPAAVVGGLTFPLYGQAGAYSGMRRALSGSTPPQRMSREAVEKAIADFERRFGKLSEGDKQAMASVIRSGLGVYGADAQPAVAGPFRQSLGGLLD